MFMNKITADDLKAAGLDPAEFQSFIGKAVTQEKLDALKLEIATSNDASLTTKLKEFETSLLAKVKDIFKPAPVRTEGNDGNNDEGDDNLDFVVDPAKTVRKIAGETAATVLAEQRRFVATQAYREVQNQPYMAIAAIKEEVDAAWKQYKPELVAQPDVLLKNIYDMIVGRHHDEIKRDTDKKEGKFNLVATGGGAGNGTPNNQGVQKTALESLTDDEKKSAKMLGLTDEQYAKSKESMKFV